MSIETALPGRRSFDETSVALYRLASPSSGATSDEASPEMLREHPVTESVTIDDQLLVTPEEAARRLSIGRTTVYELMASGELQSVSIGRCRRVPVISLSSFVGGLIGDAIVEQSRSAGRPRARSSLRIR
jgi:excisionase family DNA binding protein